ncbi:MAG: hypothetical protein QOC81_2077 [Thermoanaerobaculia bacterium]|jgi:hypothetical protein|nr:hypothetical protein [Thermoanaerobaculia bacterium]
MKRRWAFAAIALLSLVVFAAPLLRNEVFSIRDHDDYFQPLRWFTANELRHGRLPLWNVYSASGEPWLANPQTGVFYPPAWIFVALPFSAAYTLYLFFHVVLLGCGAYLLFARLTRPGGAALAAALALTFCGPVMSLLDISNNLTTFAWIPLILWCALDGVSSRASAVAIAMSFLAGEPFYAAVGALLFVIVRRRGVLDVIDVALTSFALSSIQLLPFLSMALSSDRANGGVPRATLFRDSMPLGDWLRIAIPPNLGAIPLDPHLGQHFILIVYVGTLTVFFALLGIIAGRARAVGWVALIVVCVFVGLGDHFAPSAEILARLPLTLFRYPARMVPLAVLAICALAAIGCDRVIRGRWQFAIALVMFADVVLQIQPLLVTAKFNPHRVPYPAAIGRDKKILRADQPRISDHNGWISGYLNLYDRRFDVWSPAPTLSQQYAAYFQSIEARRDREAINELSVGYILAPGVMTTFQPVASVSGVVAHVNPRGLPLAYSRDSVTHRTAPVKSLAFTPSAVFIDVNMPADGDVIVTQRAAPGWSVTVDGNAAAAREVSLFRTVHVARGSHAIKWSYCPVPLVIGAILTFAALLRLLLSSWFVKQTERIKFLRETQRNA